MQDKTNILPPILSTLPMWAGTNHSQQVGKTSPFKMSWDTHGLVSGCKRSPLMGFSLDSVHCPRWQLYQLWLSHSWKLLKCASFQMEPCWLWSWRYSVQQGQCVLLWNLKHFSSNSMNRMSTFFILAQSHQFTCEQHDIVGSVTCYQNTYCAFRTEQVSSGSLRLQVLGETVSGHRVWHIHRYPQPRWGKGGRVTVNQSHLRPQTPFF